MAITIETLAKLRPYLYHLTAQSNVASILADRTMYCSDDLLRRARLARLIQERRKESLAIQVGGRQIHIRDQKPLHRGNMKAATGWSFEKFVGLINAHVFFWPGTSDGPVTSGMNHYGTYAAEKPKILRFSTAEFLEVNRKILFLSRCNSGSPRCHAGKPVPRGPQTFQPLEEVDFSPSNVVEVVFRGKVRIPGLVQSGPTPRGPWATHRL